MTTMDAIATKVGVEDLERVLLQHRIEQFLFAESECLDRWRWAEWLEQFTDDVLYWMPVRKNRLRRQRDQDEVPEGIEMAHFYDDHASLQLRVNQMHSGTHWAEDPPSRTRHFISNIVAKPTKNTDDYEVISDLLVYRGRGDLPKGDILSGERQDILRKNNQRWEVVKRTIYLDQTTLPSANLSMFL